VGSVHFFQEACLARFALRKKESGAIQRGTFFPLDYTCDGNNSRVGGLVHSLVASTFVSICTYLLLSLALCRHSPLPFIVSKYGFHMHACMVEMSLLALTSYACSSFTL
jgi:hypothetical protein